MSSNTTQLNILFKEDKNMVKTWKELIEKAEIATFTSAMMAEKNIDATAYESIYTVDASARHFDLFPEVPKRILMSFLASTCKYLAARKIKNTKEAVALILQDEAGEFKFASILKYHDGGAEDTTGNWTIEMTVYEEDIDDCNRKVVKYLYNDPGYKVIFNDATKTVGRIQIGSDSYILDACLLTISSIQKTLEAEVAQAEDKKATIELPDFIEVHCEMDGDEYVYAFIPGARMKESIKDDASIQAK